MKLFVVFLSLILISISCSNSKKASNDKDSSIDKNSANKTGQEDIESKQEDLLLMPAVESQSDSSITFILNAQRIKFVVDEYLPNSEDFRVEIYSQKGKLVWSSNYEKNYLMVIGTVLPKQAGEIYTYKISWKGMDNNNKPAEPGNYYAQLTIPCLPNPYISKIFFKWR
jgi:hypothetical protein